VPQTSVHNKVQGQFHPGIASRITTHQPARAHGTHPAGRKPDAPKRERVGGSLANPRGIDRSASLILPKLDVSTEITAGAVSLRMGLLKQLNRRDLKKKALTDVLPILTRQPGMMGFCENPIWKASSDPAEVLFYLLSNYAKLLPENMDAFLAYDGDFKLVNVISYALEDLQLYFMPLSFLIDMEACFEVLRLLIMKTFGLLASKCHLLLLDMEMDWVLDTIEDDLQQHLRHPDADPRHIADLRLEKHYYKRAEQYDSDINGLIAAGIDAEELRSQVKKHRQESRRKMVIKWCDWMLSAIEVAESGVCLSKYSPGAWGLYASVPEPPLSLYGIIRFFWDLDDRFMMYHGDSLDEELGNCGVESPISMQMLGADSIETYLDSKPDYSLVSLLDLIEDGARLVSRCYEKKWLPVSIGG
jgi:hypothetical protein